MAVCEKTDHVRGEQSVGCSLAVLLVGPRADPSCSSRTQGHASLASVHCRRDPTSPSTRRRATEGVHFGGVHPVRARRAERSRGETRRRSRKRKVALAAIANPSRLSAALHYRAWRAGRSSRSSRSRSQIGVVCAV